jgi:hypothetical protein
MNKPSITHYPVGNGDATLIKLSDGLTILIDCNIRESEDENGNETCYDVKGDLLEQLRSEDGVPHLDIFILTHPDLDHCRGYESDFYQGDPAKYSKQDKQDQKIIIDQMWFAPRIFQDHEKLNSEAQAIKEELERRKKLFLDADQQRDTAGNRLWCIGYSDHEDLKGLQDILTVPGNSIAKFNGQDRTDLSFFVFAPVKSDSDGEDSERNDTSIAFAAEFHIDGEEAACRALFFGDNSRRVLERIYDLNKDKGNLEYDLFMAPHHTSWGAFSDGTNGKGEISVKVLALLDKKREGAHVISSSKPIKDDDKSPPSFPAKQEYVKKVGNDNFICTEEFPSEKEPTKLVFELTSSGPEKQTPTEGDKKRSSLRESIHKAVSVPKTYGAD